MFLHIFYYEKFIPMNDGVQFFNAKKTLNCCEYQLVHIQWPRRKKAVSDATTTKILYEHSYEK